MDFPRFLRIESPRISIRYALWTSRSRMPSASVGSPICSRQRDTGSGEVRMVERIWCGLHRFPGSRGARALTGEPWPSRRSQGHHCHPSHFFWAPAVRLKIESGRLRPPRGIFPPESWWRNWRPVGSSLVPDAGSSGATLYFDCGSAQFNRTKLGRPSFARTPVCHRRAVFLLFSPISSQLAVLKVTY